MKSYTIVFNISALGFGHLTRQIALYESLEKLYPQINAKFVISEKQLSAFQSYFDTKQRIETIIPPFIPRFQMSNKDTLDLESSIFSYQLAFDFDTQIRDDMFWGRLYESTDLVINDIEFFSNSIAKKMGIPIVNISNFLWSDFLHHYGEMQLTKQIMELERLSDYNIKLPFSTECYAFNSNLEYYGLLVREFDDRRIQHLRLLFKSNTKIVCILGLSSKFTFQPEDLISYLIQEGFSILIPSYLDYSQNYKDNEYVRLIDDMTTDYHNYIAASDLIIGKVGYGLVSEVINSTTPFLFWKRAGFYEDNFLANGVLENNLGYEISSETTLDEIISKINNIKIKKLIKINSANDLIAKRIIDILANNK